jgi:pyruvate dehydrogenase E2 component (dihydrolipoamide acetyltransferase)
MKRMIFIVAVLTLVVFVSGAMAQQKPAPAKPAGTPAPAPAKSAATPAPAAAPAPAAPEKVKIEKFSGVIEKVDEMAKAIEVKGKVKKEEKTMTFATDDKTKITKGKADLAFADLKKGMEVKVDFKKEGEKLIATAIKAAAPKAVPKEKKSEEKPAEAPKK